MAPGGFPGIPGFVWAMPRGFCVALQLLGIPVLCPPAGGHWESGSRNISLLRGSLQAVGASFPAPHCRGSLMFKTLLSSEPDFHPWLHRNRSFPVLSNIVLPVLPEETNEKFQSKHLPVGVGERPSRYSPSLPRLYMLLLISRGIYSSFLPFQLSP